MSHVPIIIMWAVSHGICGEWPPKTFYVWPNSSVCSGEIVLMAAAFPGLRSLCLAINKSLWITGEAGSQCSCVRVWAGQWNDWSSGGLRARKNAVWWDCRLGGRGGEGRGGGQVLTAWRETKDTLHVVQGSLEKLCDKHGAVRPKGWIFCDDILCERECLNKASVGSVVLYWHLPLSTWETGWPVSSFRPQDNNNAERPLDWPRR